MSTTVDSRVVEMQFDNSKFESNVKTSLSTLDKLKSALNFSGVSDSFSNITTSAGKVDMSPLSGAIETVHEKFSAMEVVAVTALVNITNQAIAAGEQLVKSLSVDNISAGWEKFSEKTQSVATLVSQGYDLDTVTEQLERLNWYTDETSYNFTDMVSNIAKFTASGQDLETSVTAMEGIANWAALSGQNATTASRAMYQLSQAMSAGYMRLEDYKSIQNASMDTEEFRQKCIDAAVALGTLQDNADGTYTSIVDGASSATFTLSSFTTGLTDGAWMTSDVMMEVFNEYSSAVDQIYEYSEEKGITASEAIEELGDSVDEFGLKAFKAAQEARSWADVIDSVKDAVSTGWMNTFEYIFGNEEEAVELWTDLANAMYDVFAEGGNARNEMLAEWKELGGRDVLVDAFWTAWDNIGEVLGTVKEAFRDIFPSTTADQLYSFTEGLKTFADNLKMSDKNLENLRKTFKGLFSVLDIVKQALSAVFNGVKTLFGGVGSLASSILGVTGSIGDWLVALDESIEKSDIFNKAVEKIKKKFSDFVEKIEESVVFTKITEGVTNFVEKAKEKFSTPGFNLFHEVLSSIGSVIEKVITALGNLKDKIVGVFDAIGEAVSGLTLVKVLGVIWSVIMKLASALSGALGDALSGLISALGNADFNAFFDILNSLATTGLIASVVELIHNFASGIGSMTKTIKDMKNGVVDILDGVGECLETWQNNIKADTMLKIAAAVGILAVALIALTGVDSDKMGASIAAITGLMTDLVIAMTALQQFTGRSSWDWQEGITGFLDTMSNAKMYSNMIKMAGAIAILAAAMASIGTIDSDKIDSAFGSITGLILDLTVAMIALNKLGGNVSGTTTMLGLAASVLLLSSAMKSLSELDWEEIAKGLSSVTVMLGELVAAMVLLGKYGGSTSGATTMIALAAAIKILTSACEDFADLSWEGIAKGAVAIAALLAGLVLAMGELTALNKNMISTGLALIEIAASMKIFASAMEDFGAFSWEEIAKGLVAMGAALTEVVVAMKLMPSNMATKAAGLIVMGAALEIIADVVKDMSGMSWEEMSKGILGIGVALAELAVALTYMQGSVADAAAILVVSAALVVLTSVLKSLGEMSIGELAISLIALAGALTIIGAAAVVSSIPGFTTAMLAMAGAVALVGVGLLAAGAGITALSVGITSLATSMSVSLVSIISGINAIIVAIVSLIPDILIAIGEGIVGICGVIAEGASTIGEVVVAVVLAVIDILRECVPELVEGVLDIVLQVLDALVEYVPAIVTGLVDLIIGIVEAIGDNIPKILVAVMDFIGKLFEGIIEAINGLDSSSLIEGITCVGLLSALVVALSAISGMVPAAMAALVELAGLVTEMGIIFAALGALAQIPGLEWLIGEGADLLTLIGDAIGSFIGGFIGGALEEVSSSLPQIGAYLSEFMENASVFIEGASKINSSVLTGILALAGAVVALTAVDVLSGLTSWITGGSSFVKFGMELAAFGPYFADYYDSIKEIDGDVVEASANAASALAEMAKELPNSGGVVSWFTGDNGLAAFGEELAEFGPYMKDYYESVKGIRASVVETSANAALALAEMAESLPEQGGFIDWITGNGPMSLSDFGEELASFGPHLKEYSDSIKGISGFLITNSAAAASSLAEMAKNLPDQNSVIDWIIGKGTVTLSDFGEELASFGPHLKEYSDSVRGVSSASVTASAVAASVMSTIAKNLPERSGIIDWITGSGDMSLSKFGKELAKFGPYLKEYSDSVTGVKVQTVKSSADAAEALSDMAKNLPERSSIIDWITGNGNMSLSKFGKELAEFGPYLKDYSDSLDGLSSSLISESATAANVLFDMAKNLPDQNGGFINWITGSGTVSLTDFGKELGDFGPYLIKYSKSLDGLSTSLIDESATAAKVLFEMAEHLPDQNGGFANWITGNGTISLSDFGKELEAFGPSLKAYAESVNGMPVDAATNSAAAATALAKVAEALPEQSSKVQSWFGDGSILSLSEFGTELESFGPHLKTYAESVDGMPVDAATNSAAAATALAAVADALPEQSSKIQSWFGEGSKLSLSEFGKELEAFGPSLMAYGESIADFPAGAAADSAIIAGALASIASGLPEQSSKLTSWIGGGTITLSEFGTELESFGPHLNEYAKSISAVTYDTGAKTEAIGSAITALNDSLPVSGGVVQWLTGEQSLATFGENLEAFGNSMNTYYYAVKDINTDTLSHVMDQFRRLINAAEDIQGIDETGLSAFAGNIVLIATESIDEFIDAFDDAEEEVVQAGADFVDNFRKGALDGQTDLNKTWTSLSDAVITLLGEMETDYYDEGSEFITQIISGANSQETSLKWAIVNLVNACLSMLSELNSDFKEAGETFVIYFANGFEANTLEAEDACTTVLTNCKNAIQTQYPNFKTLGWNLMSYLANGIMAQKEVVKTKAGNNASAAVDTTNDYYDDFYNAGVYLVQGFSNGIAAKTYVAQTAAAAMAAAAAIAAEDELGIASPSKVGYGIGGFFGLGFVNAIDDYADSAYNSSAEMADSARNGLSNAISKISDVIDGDIDTTPVIRPVLDLSNVESGVSELNAMLSETKAMSISASMAESYEARNQNALDVNNDDVVDAITDLRGDVASLQSVIGNLKVVMDSGALVGQLVTPMNYALGKQATYTGRGI